MRDPHIDIEDFNTPYSSTNDSDEPMVEFENIEQDRSTKGYNFWGWQRLPDMFRDFTERFSSPSRQNPDEVIPEEARRRFRNSQREFLLGWRTIIDQQLERLDARESFERARTPDSDDSTDKVKIKVEEA